MRTDKNSDRNWLLPWLQWLDNVEAFAGRSEFPEDPQLRNLHRWFLAGMAPAAAAHQLQTLKRKTRG